MALRAIASAVLTIVTLYMIIWRLILLAGQPHHELHDPRHAPSTIGVPSPVEVPTH